MFFVLRCAFWLSLVYASILWPNSGFALFGSGGDRHASARPSAISLDRAIAGAGDFCARHAADCFAGAARLTALLDATRQGVGSRDVKPSVVASHSGAAPLPVRDPRRAAP